MIRSADYFVRRNESIFQIQETDLQKRIESARGARYLRPRIREFRFVFFSRRVPFVLSLTAGSLTLERSTSPTFLGRKRSSRFTADIRKSTKNLFLKIIRDKNVHERDERTRALPGKRSTR